MRLATRIEQEEASKYAMKGFAIGAAKWGAVGVIAASGLNIVNPWFRRTGLQYKFYLVMAAALGGGAHSADRYLVNFERRGRRKQLEATKRARYDAFYGKEVFATEATQPTTA